MAEREQVEIGGSLYFIRTYEPFLSLEILGDLQSKFLAPLLPAIDAAGDDQAAAEAAGMSGIAALSAKLTGKELRGLAERLLLANYISVAVEGLNPDQPKPLDTVTRSLALKDVADIIELCIAVVKVNYTTVFRRAGSLLGAARSLTADG